MERTLRILHLEDDPRDAEIVRELLADGGIRCEVCLVDLRDNFVACLERGGLDLILADLSLPSFDGMTALAITRERNPDLPFIFVSRRMGEEAAIESLKEGATDYVLKSKLSRLVPAVKRALVEAEGQRERRRAEEALRGSEEKYRTLAENISDLVYRALPGTLRTTYVNGAVEKIFGYTVKEWLDDPGLREATIHPQDRERVLAAFKEARREENGSSVDYRIVRKDGTVRWVDDRFAWEKGMDGGILSLTGVMTDITERRNLEEQLRQAQKMEAVGTLTGGVAHDFNNILTAIIGYGNLLEMNMGDDNPLLPNVQQILNAAERAAILTRSLLAFSRKQQIEPSPVDLNAIVRGAENLLTRLLREDIEFRSVLAEGELIVMADRVQIEQVLMNLAANARDAMPKGGTVIVSTSRYEIDRDFVRAHGYGTPGMYAILSFSDTGSGMDEETRCRVFEPFFTTKEVGKGTGLGLSMAYGIVRQHQGFINCYSEPGSGTIFRTYLPITGKKRRQERGQSLPAPRGGTETILLAEDDAAVRSLARDLLESFGYRVIEAENGEEAVKRFAKKKEEIRLAVIDLVMPKKNGREAYGEIREMAPEVGVIFISGYPADVFPRTEIDEEGLEFIAKPLSPTEFLRKVREVLDQH